MAIRRKVPETSTPGTSLETNYRAGLTIERVEKYFLRPVQVSRDPKMLDSLRSESPELVTDTERSVAALWQQALNTASLPGPMDNFFAFGGDSIAMIMVELRIKDELWADLPEGAILATESLRELAQLIEENSRSSASPASCAV
jgi:hypothetical protein